MPGSTCTIATRVSLPSTTSATQSRSCRFSLRVTRMELALSAPEASTPWAFKSCSSSSRIAGISSVGIVERLRIVSRAWPGPRISGNLIGQIRGGLFPGWPGAASALATPLQHTRSTRGDYRNSAMIGASYDKSAFLAKCFVCGGLYRLGAR